MVKNLTNSYRDRQKILNNSYILQKIEQHLNISFGKTSLFRDNHVTTKQHIECLLKVSTSTIDRCITTHKQELENNGYTLLQNEELKEFLSNHKIERFTLYKCAPHITTLELFTFKAWLNIAMLLSESKQAKFVRSRILDIVLDVAIEQEDGHVKYINRSLDHWIFDTGYQALVYSMNFFNATKEYLDLNHIKKDSLRYKYRFSSFACHYHEIYKLVFGEKYQTYRDDIANNTSSNSLDRVKNEREGSFDQIFTGYRLYLGLYFEVRQAIFSLENETAKAMQLLSKQEKRKITRQELDKIVANLVNNPNCQLCIQEARRKIAIIDYFYAHCKDFKSTLNKKLETHYKSVAETDLDRFISAKNKSLKEKLSKPENLAVFQRLKDR